LTKIASGLRLKMGIASGDGVPRHRETFCNRLLDQPQAVLVIPDTRQDAGGGNSIPIAVGLPP
jgi:hypothetical protein